MAPLRSVGDFPRYLGRLKRRPGDVLEFNVDKVVDVPRQGTGRLVLSEQVRDLPRDPRNEHLVRVEDIRVGDATSVLRNDKITTQQIKLRVEIATRTASRGTDYASTSSDLLYVRATKPLAIGGEATQQLVRRLPAETGAVTAEVVPQAAAHGGGSARQQAYRALFRKRKSSVQGVPLASARTVVRFVLNVPPEGNLSPIGLDPASSSRQLRIRYTCKIHIVRPYAHAAAGTTVQMAS